MASPAGSLLQVKQRKNNHKLRRVVQPLAAFSAHDHDAVGRALLSVTASSSTVADSSDCPLGMPAAMFIEEALDRVAIWKLRSACLPHAVESTAALAQVLLRINSRRSPQSTSMSSTILTARDSSSPSSLLELQHALACAVLRTVNGLADALQQQRAFAASVAVLCRELGIPSWLVDIRHAATHNQLPSLPVLQLAANALLQYLQTVYWEPLAERRQEQYRHAVDLLRAYDDRDGAALETSTLPSSISNNPNGNPHTFITKVMESSESEEDSEDFNSLVQSMLPIPGTNGNRFSLLLDDGKRTKAKRQAAARDPSVTPKHDKSVAGTPAASASASAPKKKKVKTDCSKQRQYDMTRSTCAKLFIRSKLPLDIKYEAALDFLLGDNGVLLQCKSPPNGDTNSFSLADLQLHYETLLVTLCCAWPGFLGALLIRSVNLVLAVANGPAADDPSARAAECIVQWMQYWLSSSFIHLLVDHSASTPTTAAPSRRKICGDSTNGKHSSTLSETVLAPWSMLQAAPLGLPLNSLCDRCEAFTTAAADRQYPSVASLKQLFKDILGDERCANFGVADNILMKPAMVSDEHRYHGIIRPCESVASKAESATDCILSAQQPSMSLEAMETFMEAFLAKDGGADDKADVHDKVSVASANTHDLVPPMKAWVRCVSWEPCSIGTLPGFGGCL